MHLRITRPNPSVAATPQSRADALIGTLAPVSKSSLDLQDKSESFSNPDSLFLIIMSWQQAEDVKGINLLAKIAMTALRSMMSATEYLNVPTGVTKRPNYGALPLSAMESL